MKLDKLKSQHLIQKHRCLETVYLICLIFPINKYGFKKAILLHWNCQLITLLSVFVLH